MIKVRRLIKSFVYAFRGLFKVIREEQNLRIQIVVSILAVLVGFLLHITLLEWAIIVLIIGLVILMEILNSAVERVSDVLKPRIHTYVKDIKDIMAAAVMVSSIMAVVVGVIIFGPYLVDFF